MVLASRICCSTHVSTLLVTEHRYCKMNLVVSVLPAPLSPDITQDWLLTVSCSDLYAASARANTCGSRAPIFWPWYRLTYSCKKTAIERPFVSRVVNEAPPREAAGRGVASRSTLIRGSRCTGKDEIRLFSNIMYMMTLRSERTVRKVHGYTNSDRIMVFQRAGQAAERINRSG